MILFQNATIFNGNKLISSNSVLVEKNKMHSYVNLAGKVTDKELSDMYNNSDLFVLAHRMLSNGDTEGCPTVFSEAGAHGIPLIGGNDAGASTAIIDGINGLFVSMPSQKGNDDEYYDTVWIDSKQLREELTTLAISEYQNPSSSEENNMQSEPETAGDNIKETNKDTPPAEDVASPAFSDDDIPF